MYIKHTSRHYYKLGPNREFFDQENPLPKEATAIVVEMQDKYDSLIQYLEDCYHSLRAGGKAPETPEWLEKEVNERQPKPQATEADLNSQLLRPQPEQLSMSVQGSSGNQNLASTPQTSGLLTESW